MDDNTKRVIPTPVTPTETVYIESLGGDVVVHGTTILGQSRIMRAVRDEEQNNYSGTAYMLSLCVRTPDGEKVYTPEMFDIWGGANREEANKLSNICLRIVGLLGGESEKK